MKTLHFSIIAGIIFASCFVLSDAHAQDCMGGQYCGGNTQSTYAENRNLTVSLNFYPNSAMPDNVHYLWLRFSDAKNDTLIKNVSFFINATKGDNVLMHELFYTKTGLMLMKFYPSHDTGKLIINGTSEPMLGGIMSENDTLPITTSVFAENGTYRIHLEVLATNGVNELIDPSNPVTFDSQWLVDEKGNISKYDNNVNKTSSKLENNTVANKISSPLQQFKSGVALKDITCAPDLKLVIKAKSRSPACVKLDDISKLVKRGWADKPNSLQEQLDFTNSCIGMTDACRHRYDVITGLNNDTGMMTLENQTYYFDTPNYTATTYVHPVQITFHDVNFTLFPPGFRGGLPLGGCPGQYYWVDAKFADGTAELLHIYAGSQSCADSVPFMLSNHFIPQAGLTVYGGKMRLLVRDENQSGKDIVLQKPSSMVKPFPICDPNPAKEKLIREKQQILTDALLAEEKKYGGFENRTKNLPWSSIGYDCVDNALEVGILPQYFNSDFLPKYFEKIRSIVGNTIDIVLSPREYASPV